MAKGTAICTCKTCGKEFKVEKTCQNRAAADSFVEYAVSHYDMCDDCAHEEAMKKRAAENAASAEKAAAMKMAELTGTPKQIAWAETIRVKAIEFMEEKLAKLEASEKADDNDNRIALFKRVIAAQKSETRASFWIENKDPHDSGKVIFDKIVKEMITNTAAPEEKEQSEKESEPQPKEETIIKPENSTETIIVKVCEDKEAIYILSPKNDKIIEIAKSLKYKWNGGRWELAKGFRAESPVDRMAEIGNKLLNAGFAVDCKNPKAREKAVSGDYSPAAKHWITAPIKNDNYVSIDCEYGSDAYLKAKHLPSYRNGWVNISAYKEIRDFADIYGAKLSPGAEERLSEYEAKINRAKEVKPTEVKVEETDKLKEILNSDTDVLSELRDD